MSGMDNDQNVDGENFSKRIGKSVLDHFQQISNENENVRIKNATYLLQYLHRSSTDGNLDEVQYALERIVRGLGGSKNSTRIGFYSALATILFTFPFITVEEILKCVQKHLQVERGNSKSEIGDIYTGQVLVCGALIRTKKIFAGDPSQQKEVLQLLIDAGKNRSYLSMATAKFLAELLDLCDKSQFMDMWSVLNTHVLKPWSEQDLDSLFLLLLIQKAFPSVLKNSTENLNVEKNLNAVCNIALNVTSISSLKHFFYSTLAETLASLDIDLLFVSELDCQLEKYNRSKVMASSLIIRKMLPHLRDTSQIPQMLPNNFVRQILNHYRYNRSINKNDKEFHEEISNFFDCLCQRLRDDAVDDKTKVTTLKRLIFYPGSFMFESVTKSKNIQKVIRTLDKEGIKKLSSLYRDVLIAKKEKTVAPNITEQWLNSERIYAAQLLTKLLNFPSAQGEMQWKIKNLKVFMDIVIFKDRHGNVGTELASNVKDVFFRALDLKFNKLEDVASVLFQLIEYLQSAVTESNESLRTPLLEDDLEILNKTYSVVAKLNDQKDECALVFRVLFLHMCLQLFHDKELAVSSLNELFSCYDRVSRKRKFVNEGDPEWIEVVVDLFLNLLSHNSLLLRNVVGSVFPYLRKYLTPSSIHQILSVLDPKSDSNPLSRNDSESESDEDNVDSDENQSDDDENEENETVNDKLRIAVQAALGQNGYHTDEESVDLDDMNEDDAEKLDEALADAFRRHKPNRGKSKKQSKQAETLTHFRIRVLDLLEIYLDLEPDMLSCLEMMLPLLQMLEFSIRDDHQKPLLARVRHCSHKLCTVKKFNSVEGVTDDILGNLLNSVLEKGTKNSLLLQDMSNEISECCVFIIKCAEFLPVKIKKRCQDEIIKILTNAVNVYFRQRDCLIPYYLYKNVFQLDWEGNRTFVPLLFDFVFDKDIRPFRRNQALDLLKTFYSNRRSNDTCSKFFDDLTKHEKRFCDDIVNMFDEFCQRPKNKTMMKEKFVRNLFKLLKAMFQLKRNEGTDWIILGEKIREFRSFVPLSKDAKMTYNQLCKSLRIPQKVTMKTETIKLSDKDDSDREGTVKKRNKGEFGKEKKEAKSRRIQNMSEGLSGYSFDKLNLEEEDYDIVITNGSEAESFDKPTKTPNNKRKQLAHAQRSPKKHKTYTNGTDVVN